MGIRRDIAGHGGADGGRGRYRVRPRFLPSRQAVRSPLRCKACRLGRARGGVTGTAII